MKNSIVGVFHRNYASVQLNFPESSLYDFHKPEEYFLIQPEQFVAFHYGKSGSVSSHQLEHLYVVLSGRIDNIGELLQKLNCPELSYKSTRCPAELIARAYLKWKQDCPKHFLGDFAFAIWDAKQQQLFCARDQFGVKPFYYAFINHSFYFSSSLQSILDIEAIPEDINDERIFDYVASTCVDNTSTFYKNIFRLPPAHTLTISRETHEFTRYWQYVFTGELLLADDNQYEEAFREIFTEAVHCRINSDQLAILLSGGLDSTSVACIAEKLTNADISRPLHVYSGVFNTHRQCDEQNYISETLRSGNYRWQTNTVDKSDPLESLFEIASIQNEPWFAPNMYMSWNLLKLMQADGRKLLLDGHDGDSIISSGWGYFTELLNNSSLIAFFKELYLSKRVLSPVEQRSLIKLLYKKKVGPHLLSIMTSLRIPGRKKNHATQLPGAPNSSYSHYLHSSFLERPEIRKRIEIGQVPKTPHLYERDIHYKNVFHPIQPLALEVLYRTADAFSIEYRCPFWDKRLVEFCLSLPASQIFKNGYPRSILRRGMNNIIPPKIQWRPDKTDFLPSVIKIADLIYNDSADNPLLQARENISRWIDLDKFLSYHRAHPENKNAAFFDIWKVLTLHAWLETRKEKRSHSVFS
jgi:asparagine synthase (glutamine-hydrolysing)